jgi:hypothetical protein
VPRGSGLGLAAPEAGRDCLADHLQGQSLLLVQLRREAHLRVHHTVGGEVGHRLGGDALDRGLGLHHGERVLERRQVLQDVARVGATGEPGLQRVDVGLGQRPTDRVGQLDDRRRAQTAVEVVVQQHLGREDVAVGHGCRG